MVLNINYRMTQSKSAREIAGDIMSVKQDKLLLK